MANSILASMAVILKANNSEFNASLKQSQAQLKSFQSVVSTVGSSLGVSLGGAAVFQGLKYGISVIADFEASMSEVKAITQSTGREFEALTKNALDLGAATKFTAKEVSQLQVAYGRLGFTTSEILNATKATIDLATATGEDLAKSADIAGSTIRAFGLDASETQRVADVMASSFNKSALGLDNFGEAMKYVAPVAANANISLEQTTALLGVLADAGIRGSSAGTALRKIISDLGQGAAPVLTKRLKELAASGLSGAQAMDEVGRTAYAALLVLSKNTEKVDEATEAYKNATGEVSAMAAVMQNNLAGDVTKLSSAFDGLILSLGTTDKLRSWTKELTSLLNIFNGNKSAQLTDEISKLAIVMRTNNPGNKGFINETVEKIGQLRKELGIPIEEGLIKSIITEFKLSGKEADNFRKKIEEINNSSLSFDEQVIKNFTNYSKGYEDITKAAFDYNNELRHKILLNKQDEMMLGKDGRKTSLEVMRGLQEDNKQLDKATQIVYAYAQAKAEAAKIKPTSPETVELVGKIKAAEEELAKFEKAKKDALTDVDISKFGQKIEDIKQKLHVLNNTGVDLLPKNLVNDEPIKLPSFDSAGLVKSSKEVAGIVKGVAVTISDATTQVKDNLVTFSVSIGPIITEFAQTLGEFFGDLASSVNGVEPFQNRLKKLLGGLMQSVGGALIAVGTAKLVLTKSVNPYVAIAAGVALVAAGAALSRAASNTSKAINGGGSGSSGGNGSSGSRIDDYQARETNIVINGGQPLEFVISGDQLRAWDKKSKYVTGKGG